jgi:hypothetical protein
MFCCVARAALAGGCDAPVDSAPPDPPPLSVVGVESPAAPGSMAPHLAVSPAGAAVLNWLEPAADGAHAVRFALLRDGRWSPAQTVVASDGWFVNWADFPSVVPITERQWAAHWLVKRPGGTYSYDIAVATSANAGAAWAPPLTPHTDGTPTEHGFVTMFPWSGGIGAVWLDGRNMQPDAAAAEQHGERDYGGMTLRYARFAYDGTTLEEGEIDDLVCECCQTDAALTTDGPIVVYRDRSAEEIRDISLTRYESGAWTTPLQVSDDDWLIPACPVNGPAIAAAGDLVAVAWYAAPKRDSRVKLAWSRDGGRTFGAPVLVDAGGVSGRVDVELLGDGDAMVSWMGRTDDGAGQVRVRRVSTAGEPGPMHVVAEGAFTRNSGFPQMVRAGDRLVFAWPEPRDPKRVLTAVAPLPAASR